MVPLQTSTKVGFGGTSSTVNCDWIGSFHGPLSQGWKLVTIFFDMSTTMNIQSLTTSNVNINTLWIFEKPKMFNLIKIINVNIDIKYDTIRVMGCGSSSNGGGTVINQAVAAPPYDGPQVEYQFVNTQVGMTMKMFAFSEGNEMASSDIDSFYPALSSKMAEGYHLVAYRNIPGQTQTAFLSTTTKFPYQGIFMKRQDEPNQSFKLLIEKSSVQATRIRGGLIPLFGAVETQGDSSHLIASIAKNTQSGGRFVCMGTSGQMTSSGLGNMISGKTPVCGVDLFFEIPDGPSESCVYQTVVVPLQTSTKVGFGGASSTVNCDWIGSFHGPLSQGWKLVTIFFDMSTTMNMQSLTTSNVNLNTLWIFEKPAAVVNDATPRYEGKMIEFQFDMKVGFTGTSSSISWEPKILEMGRNGWELATILDSPGVQTAGFGKAALKLMMFFQRKILR